MADPSGNPSFCVLRMLNWCSEGGSDYLYSKLPLDSCS